MVKFLTCRLWMNHKPRFNWLAVAYYIGGSSNSYWMIPGSYVEE